MYLCNSNLILISHTALIICILGYIKVSTLTSSDHTIIHNLKWLIKHDVAVDLPDDIILNEHKSINFDMNSKSISIEACTYLFINLNKDIICWLLYWPLTVLLRYRIYQFELLQRNLSYKVIKCARVYFLCICINQIFEMLTICELGVSEINDFIHKLIYQYKISPQ